MDAEFRGSRRPQGNRPSVQERETYFRLVDQGMSFAEAARTVGVSTRTGERWRNGRGASGRIKAHPPINAAPVAEPTDPSRYPREADRVHIAELGQPRDFPEVPEHPGALPS
ncbi:helix-turn-helix domain-containing protein [Streptomyces chartreusis]|uniref:helix-turn-helix domain-containing protein n=1 Tax=Streptomyces chartreusis TaxID=1969 RepID=UPI003684E5E3